MSTKSLYTRIENKHDLEVNWERATFIPLQGELIVYDIEVDAAGNVLKDADGNALLPSGRTTPYTYERLKIGDGIHTVKDLPFMITCGAEDPSASTMAQFYFKYSV